MSTESRPETVSFVLLHLFLLQSVVSIAAVHLARPRKINVTFQVVSVLSSILFPATAFLEIIVIVFVTLSYCGYQREWRYDWSYGIFATGFGGLLFVSIALAVFMNFDRGE